MKVEKLIKQHAQSYDRQVAAVLGIPLVRGWRKQVRRHILTEDQAKQVRVQVAATAGQKRLKRMAEKTQVGCPYSLHPESEISGELYFRLRQAGLSVKLEVAVPSTFHVSGTMRIDIGVFYGGRLVCAIECKRQADTPAGRRKPRIWKGSQLYAYTGLRKYGVAVEFVSDPAEIPALVEKLSRNWL